MGELWSFGKVVSWILGARASEWFLFLAVDISDIVGDPLVPENACDSGEGKLHPAWEPTSSP